jgi:hypothetical protein
MQAASRYLMKSREKNIRNIQQREAYHRKFTGLKYRDGQGYKPSSDSGCPL